MYHILYIHYIIVAENGEIAKYLVKYNKRTLWRSHEYLRKNRFIKGEDERV